jgi:hypothetical protein
MKERSTSAPRIIGIGSHVTVRVSTSYRTFKDSIALSKKAELGNDLMLLGELILAPVQFTPPVVGQRDLIVSIHKNASGNQGVATLAVLDPSMVAPRSTACLIEPAVPGSIVVTIETRATDISRPK